LKILVVDDDQDLCILLSRFLEKNGHIVFSAGDVLQALDILERETVGMIITDLMMPHIDGIGFTDRIRNDPKLKSLPIIMITAHPSEEVIDRSMRVGASMTLPKPIDFDRLLTLVNFAQ
jgi:two-component system, chemotaxis family, chemotaxis protein CheY